MHPDRLTLLQVEAARLFFSLPQSAGFAAAGGAALIARHLIERATLDVDLFLVDPGTSTVTAAAAAFEAAMDSRGWSHRRVLDQHDFVRMAITTGEESVIVDLGRDSPVEEPLGTTDLGPTLSPRDLAARKTLALFGRAEPRDFADVYDLAQRYGRERLLKWAAADDPGFDKQIFTSMLASIDRLTDDDLTVGDPHRITALRTYFRDWVTELTGR